MKLQPWILLAVLAVTLAAAARELTHRFGGSDR